MKPGCTIDRMAKTAATLRSNEPMSLSQLQQAMRGSKQSLQDYLTAFQAQGFVEFENRLEGKSWRRVWRWKA